MARQFKGQEQAFISALLTALVLLLNAMVASPSLHERLHSDGAIPGHQCAATLFAHGQVESASVDIQVSRQQTFEWAIPSVEISVVTSLIEHLPSGRAPPASFLHS